MDTPVRVRSARVEDAAEMARVNVRAWRETYRGVMADHVLDDPELPGTRERFWTAMLSDDRYRANRVGVAERDGEMIGIVMAGPPRAPSRSGPRSCMCCMSLRPSMGPAPALPSWMP